MLGKRFDIVGREHDANTHFFPRFGSYLSHDYLVQDPSFFEFDHRVNLCRDFGWQTF